MEKFQITWGGLDQSKKTDFFWIGGGGSHPIHIFLTEKDKKNLKKGEGGLAKSIFFLNRKRLTFNLILTTECFFLFSDLLKRKYEKSRTILSHLSTIHLL